MTTRELLPALDCRDGLLVPQLWPRLPQPAFAIITTPRSVDIDITSSVFDRCDPDLDVDQGVAQNDEGVQTIEESAAQPSNATPAHTGNSLGDEATGRVATVCLASPWGRHLPEVGSERPPR
ncbi:MAG: hypothetical protein HIU84_02380 [Acidobacteria bacterium]|nr:hypothetical protein [Acidobacteriota bacterium]